MTQEERLDFLISQLLCESAEYKDIPVSEEDVRGFYEQNLQRFSIPEERRASHILIAIDADKDEAAAKKEADELYAKLQADPKQFASLARKHSADPGSAREGGDLGFFRQGMMVPEFDRAVFAGKKGDLVAPVKTDFGYHIIRIDDIKAAKARPLAEVRGEIETLYRQEAAVRMFAEDAETFSNMVYEQSESLAPVVEQFKLTVQKATGITRNHEDSIINPNVVEALFSFDVLQDKRNTNAIEIAANTLLAARVTNHRPQTVEPLDKVKGNIKTALTNTKAAQAAKVEGEALLAKLQKGEKIDRSFGKASTLSRENPGEYTYEVVTAALRPQADKLPSFTGVQTRNGNYTVINVQSAKKIEAAPEQLAMRKAELAQLYSNAEQAAFMNALENKFGVEILKDEYKPGYQPAEDDVQ